MLICGIVINKATKLKKLLEDNKDMETELTYRNIQKLYNNRKLGLCIYPYAHYDTMWQSIGAWFINSGVARFLFVTIVCFIVGVIQYFLSIYFPIASAIVSMGIAFLLFYIA